MFGVFLVGPLCRLSIYTPPNPQLDSEHLPISMLSFSLYSYPIEYWLGHLHICIKLKLLLTVSVRSRCYPDVGFLHFGEYQILRRISDSLVFYFLALYDISFLSFDAHISVHSKTHYLALYGSRCYAD
jgi:hypothetical protein